MKVAKIIEISVLEDYKINFFFDDGLSKIVDINPFIKNGVSSALRDINYFRKVQLQDGFICWENGFDFCPNFLYEYN